MSDLNQKVKDLAIELERMKNSLNLAGKKGELSKLEAISTDSKLWDNPENAKKIMQELGNLRKEIDEVEDLEEKLFFFVSLSESEDLSLDFKAEIENLEKRFNKLKLSSFLSGPYDSKNTLVSIHAGQGGTEAMDWVSMLYRMYVRFCEKKGWLTETIDISEGEEAGIKSITFKVEGLYTYGYLKGEAGTHRLVRQSPFNADQKRETSFALVEILPELEELDLPNVQIKEEDLEWQFFRASAQGGQNVQKVSTAVRVKHKPTNVVVTAQAERFQEQNRKIAINLLRGRLWALEQKKKEEKIEEIKGDYRPASWGNQIRSYVLRPYKMVKDLRTNIESSNPDAVLDGDLDEFIEAEIQKL